MDAALPAVHFPANLIQARVVTSTAVIFFTLANISCFILPQTNLS
jgi:hypothetical protein